MKVFSITRLMGSILMGIGLAGPSPVRAAAPERPNILILMSDDMSMDGVGAFGGEVRTPNLDRLAARGVSFMNTYNPGSWHAAVCIASRTMLMTGRSLYRAEKIDGSLKREVEQGRFWPQLLERAGYSTRMSGKWHVGVKPALVFQTLVRERPGMPKAVPSGYHRPSEDQPDRWSPYDTKLGGHWQGGKHWAEVLADDAVALLKQEATNSAPFFMYLAFSSPHDPRQAPKRFVDGYPAERVTVPENFLPVYPYREEMEAGETLRDETLAPFPRTPRAIQVHRQEYYAIIEHMDEQIGRILDALEKSGKADSTLVIFTGDHGLAVGRHGLLGKQNMFEHSMQTPLILAGAGMPAGRRIDTPVYMQDIVPTTLELAGAEIPGHVDFRSLLPLVRGERETQYDVIFGGYTGAQRMLREGDWKVIVYPKAKKTLLFNLREDPLEMRDLSEDPRHAATLQRLLATLRAQQRAHGDSLAF